MKHYKLQTGGNRNIFDVLTIDDNGRMTLTFHGTDRTITHEATANDDGWIAAGSSLYPPLSCGKWAESPADAKGTRKRENEAAKGTRKRENEGEKPETKEKPCGETQGTVAKTEEKPATKEKPCGETQGAVAGTEEKPATKEKPCGEAQGTVAGTEEKPATAKGTRERENEGEKPATKVAGTERRTGTERKKTTTERNIYASLYGDYFQEAQQKEKENQKQIIFAGIATVVVFIILVNFIGIFGLAALGLMAGGIVK